MSNEERFAKPDVVLRMTHEQYQKIMPLKKKQKVLNQGMILGSVAIQDEENKGDTIGLSYIPHELALKIKHLADEYFGGKDANSETTKV